VNKIQGQPSLFLLDLKGKEYPALAEVNRKKRVNGQREISLSFLYEEINADFLHEIEFGWKILFKGEWYTITSPTYALDGDKFNVGVDAVLSFFVDLNGHYLQDELEDKSKTPASYFRELFEGTGYNFVLADNLAANTLNYQANQSKTERFLYGIDRFKGEYVIRGKTAYIHGLIGSDKDVILHEDLNIQDVSVEVDGSGFHTWAKGFGDKDDNEEDADYKLEVEYVSPLVTKHGYIEGQAIRDGSYKQKDSLIEAVKKQVENSYKVSTTITAVDLTNNGYPEMQFEEGDRVWLYVDRLKLNTQVRVVEIDETFDWEGNIIAVQYTIGNEGIAARYKTQQYDTLSDFRDIQNGRKTLEFNWLPEAIKRASDIINGNIDSHFKYGAGEIIGINRSNPNEYMRFNTDGIGFSRDGGKTYRSAITYEGIVADAITTGTLRSILVEAVEIYGSRIEGTEVYGGYIEGAEIVSKESDDVFIRLRGSELVSRGVHDRTWMGESGDNQVRVMIQNGQVRARNDDKNWSLYFNDYGISTFRDGNGDHADMDASGFIEFHSTRYHESRGLTIGSGARLALETNNGRIYLNPRNASVRVADENDNYLPIVASNIGQSSRANQKRDIKELQDDALEVINSLRIVEYKRLTGGESTMLDHWQVGILVEESPSQFLADGDSVDLYSYLNYVARAQQQHYDITMDIEKRLSKLEESA